MVVNDTAPDDTILQFKARWSSPDPFPDILGDAAFGSEAVLQELKGAKVDSLFSMPSDSHPYLWEVLSAGLTPNTWRAAQNEEGLVASVHMHRDSLSNKVSYHQVISTMHTGKISLYNFIFSNGV